VKCLGVLAGWELESQHVVSKVHVRNFKSFKDLEVTLGPNNVLVGPNMSGQSNFLDVFRFLVDLVTPGSGIYGINQAFNKRNGFPEVVWKGAESDLIAIQLEGEVLDAENEFLPWHYGVEIIGDMRFGTSKIQSETLRIRKKGSEIVLVESKGNERALRRINGQPYSSISDPTRSALEYEIPDREAGLIRRVFTSWRFYSLVPPLMQQVNPGIGCSDFVTAVKRLIPRLALPRCA